MTTDHGRRGISLVECALALLVSSVVLAAVWALLMAGWRTARASTSVTAVRQGVRATASALAEELLGVSAAAGDILALSDSSLTLRATRVLGFLCAAPSGSAVVLGDSLLSATRTVDPSRDSALLFREGDAAVSDDDRWLHAGISSTRGSPCADGTSGTRLVLAGPGAADLAGVTVGAPVRVFEVLEYRRYVDASGLGWLGTRGPASGGGWAATSPLAGPLRPRDGIVLRFTDRDGRPTAVGDDVAVVEAVVHGLDPRPFLAPGRPLRASADSATMRAFVGGP